MNEKIDLRVVKTKRNIKSAMVSLLNEKDFHDITVQDILDRALINRSTFYRYYDDKYDLAKQLCKSCLNGARNILEEPFQMDNHDELVRITKKMYDYILDEKDTFEALLKVKTDSISLYKDFGVLLKKSCVEFLKVLHPELPHEFADYSGTLYASAVMATINWLSENNYTNYLTDSSKEEKITRILLRLSHVLDGIFETA